MQRWSNYAICFLGWFVVQFMEDAVYSDPVQQSKLENEEWEDGHDVTFKIGDSCKAPWRDGGLYDGKVVFETIKVHLIKCLVQVILTSLVKFCSAMKEEFRNN